MPRPCTSPIASKSRMSGSLGLRRESRTDHCAASGTRSGPHTSAMPWRTASRTGSSALAGDTQLYRRMPDLAHDPDRIIADGGWPC
jgi:hypothetical protein